MTNNKYKKIVAHFESADLKMYEVLKSVNFYLWFESSNKEKYFAALCRAIIGQQLAGKAAKAIFARFLLMFDAVDLTAENLLRISDENLRNVGMSWAKVKSLKDLATKQIHGDVNLDTLDTLTDAEVVKELTKVKGIGPWTAEMFLMFTLQRPNVFSYGDLGLRNGLKKIYKIRVFSEKNLNKIIKKWEPYKTYGAIGLWHSLDNM